MCWTCFWMTHPTYLSVTRPGTLSIVQIQKIVCQTVLIRNSVWFSIFGFVHLLTNAPLVKNKDQVVYAIEDFLTIKFQEPEDSTILIMIISNQIYRSNIKPEMTDQVFHQEKNSKNRFSISRLWTRPVHRTSVHTKLLSGFD